MDFFCKVTIVIIPHLFADWHNLDIGLNQIYLFSHRWSSLGGTIVIIPLVSPEWYNLDAVLNLILPLFSQMAFFWEVAIVIITFIFPD
jgi:hypothetical protein